MTKSSANLFEEHGTHHPGVGARAHLARVGPKEDEMCGVARATMGIEE